MESGAPAYSIYRFPFSVTRVTIESAELIIDEGRYHLALPFDQVVQEMAYGYLGVQGLYMQMKVD